ncbi:MAG: sodium:dicarboxylate symporter [Phycisphaerae bacterium]|nr:sodium:dicarboxylate symporter [Phycisphaerae bacterium]
MNKGTLLTILIILGLVAGAIFGEILYKQDTSSSFIDGFKMWGNLVLVRPLSLLVIPIVLVSVVVGVTSIGDPSRLGLIGGSTILYYLVTMLLAVILGTTLVATIQPGTGLTEEQSMQLRTQGEMAFQSEEYEEQRERIESAERNETVSSAWMNILTQLIPTNLFEQMAKNNTLGIIFFSLLLGLALAVGGERTLPAVRMFQGLFEGLMIIVNWVVWLTPIGVFMLVTYTVGVVGIGNLIGPISMYMLIVLGGLLAHAFIVLPVILAIFGRANPYRFMFRMRRALLLAFGTASSAATLPVTLDTAENEGGCSKRASNFVLPLGATVNMDGTALYEAIAVVFLFQLYGIELQFGELLIVVITATLAAIGAAGIPSAGLVTMVIVIAAVNTSLPRDVPQLPLAAIGVILGVDRILDMCRTSVNVWGDSVGARIISRLAPDESEQAR